MPLWNLLWRGKGGDVLGLVSLVLLLLVLPIFFSSSRLAQAGASPSVQAIVFPTAPIRPRLPAIATNGPTRLPSSPTPSPTAGNTSMASALLPTATPSEHTPPTDSQTNTDTQTNNAPGDLSQLWPTPVWPDPVITETATTDQAPPTATTPPLPASIEILTDGVVRSVRVPILMYHYLSTPPANADIYRLDLSVRPEIFAAHLDRMQAEGYSTITLYDLYAHLMQGAPLPAKPVILTFDDGYSDNYENAFPRLKERGMKATFFVVINFINGERAGYMNWDMLREMAAAGMSIEGHSLDHSSLRRRSREDLLFQALRCYETIQNQTGHRSRFFSYPAGQYDQLTMDILAETGYWAAVTTVQGATHRSDNPFQLLRVRVRGTTSADDLVNLLLAE